MEKTGGGGGGGGGRESFGYENFHNHPSPFQQNIPLTPLDRFLWGHQQALLNVEDEEETSHFPTQNGVYYNDHHDLPCPFNNGHAPSSHHGVSWPSLPEASFVDAFHHRRSMRSEELGSTIFKKNGSSKDQSRENKVVRNHPQHLVSSPSTVLIKGQWSEEEDRRLIMLVRQYGATKWAQIAENMVGRAGKQCRERWHNHLRPDIKIC